MAKQTAAGAGAAQPGGQTRRLPRFFVQETLGAATNVQIDQLAQQMALVLRMRPGDELILLDGSGLEFHCRLLTVSHHSAGVAVLASRPCLAEPRRQLSLLQCSLKQDKFEWVLQKGTELGVSRFVPVISQRSIVRPAAALLKKYARWEAILREAAEQCGRARIPTLATPLEWRAAVASTQTLRLLPWEGAQSGSSLRQVLQENQLSGGDLSILIGPEGGVSEQEAQAALANGWQLVTLGPRILRAETAALAAAAIVLSE